MNNTEDNFYTDSLGQKWRKDYFVYTVIATNIPAAGGQQAQQIAIDSDSQFVWEKTAYTSKVNAGISQPVIQQRLDFLTVAITDASSGRNLQNSPAVISTIAGVQGLPFILSQPRIFKENSTIQITFQNLESSALDVALSFIGFKLFRV
jgi:hypothetical protein